MESNQFEIYIDYDKDADNPERVFLALADIVSELSNFDKIICESLAIKVESKIVLDKVESDYEKYEWLKENGCTNFEDRRWMTEYMKSNEYHIFVFSIFIFLLVLHIQGQFPFHHLFSLFFHYLHK